MLHSVTASSSIACCSRQDVHRYGLLPLRSLLKILQEVGQGAADAEQVGCGHDDLQINQCLDDLYSNIAIGCPAIF